MKDLTCGLKEGGGGGVQCGVSGKRREGRGKVGIGKEEEEE